MENARGTARRRGIAIGLAAALTAAISWLPAGIGNVGRKNTTLSGSFVRVTLPSGPAIEHTIIPGQTAESARNTIVTRINAETAFTAAAINDPDDPNVAAFEVFAPLRYGGIVRVQIDENDINMDDIGVRQPAGAEYISFARANSPGNTALTGGIYRLRITMQMCPPFDITLNTSVSPNNTLAGLDSSIQQSLVAAGFMVSTSGSFFVVRRPDDLIVSLQVDSSDAGIKVHNASAPAPASLVPASVLPTLADYALFALALALTAAGMLLLRRRRVEGPAGS